MWLSDDIAIDIDKIDYKGFQIKVVFRKRTAKFESTVLGINTPIMTSFEMPLVIEMATDQIDAFLARCPSTYQELAEALTDNLHWISYDDAEVNAVVLETLVENFLKARDNVSAS